MDKSTINPNNIHLENIRLRRATTDDITALDQLISACYPSNDSHTDKLYQLITSDNAYVFCVDDPNKVPVACVGVHFDGVAHISPWVVSPHLQGMGIGRVMLHAIRTFATRHAKSRGISALTLSLAGDVHPSDFTPDDAFTSQGLTLFKSPL